MENDRGGGHFIATGGKTTLSAQINQQIKFYKQQRN